MTANPEGWDKLRIEYDNCGFFHGYYVRKKYDTLFAYQIGWGDCSLEEKINK